MMERAIYSMPLWCSWRTTHRDCAPSTSLLTSLASLASLIKEILLLSVSTKLYIQHINNELNSVYIYKQWTQMILLINSTRFFNLIWKARYLSFYGALWSHLYISVPGRNLTNHWVDENFLDRSGLSTTAHYIKRWLSRIFSNIWHPYL